MGWIHVAGKFCGRTPACRYREAATKLVTSHKWPRICRQCDSDTCIISRSVLIFIFVRVVVSFVP
jgi:hypothetical protein